jgi:subtilase family serine protease
MKNIHLFVLKVVGFSFCLMIIFVGVVFGRHTAEAAYSFDTFSAKPPIHVLDSATVAPHGLSPNLIKNIYHLPTTGGSGTIAIITAYHDPTIENDLAVFDTQFGLDSCTTKNKCFTRHMFSPDVGSNSGWSLETSLDVEWAHAIAPKAKILLVEAPTPSGKNLLKAIDYARAQKEVVAISMSWGGDEFSDEATLDSHFVSVSGAPFFAASGDDGAGVSWPAVSPNVIGVGGTGLVLRNGIFASEHAWQGSGGGVSIYELQPYYQTGYSIPRANHMRAVPDVSYNADPSSGYSIFKTTGKSGKGWYVVGGTSAGTPQWAAIASLGHNANNQKFYADKTSDTSATFFRDIISGANGDCSYYCDAHRRYDYVTGLGSPLTVNF